MPEKFCATCGGPINFALANCPHCGARVGTVFSEKVQPVETLPKKRRAAQSASPILEFDKAKSRANNSLILSLGSFICPGLGFVLAAAAVFMGLSARKVFVQSNIEEGRGTATAGIVVGSISLIAQASYIIYFLKSGFAF
jgi:hypothetical protein